jgi:hypothetical protein
MVLKVVICGGGIGGLTTALCIDRLCGNNVELEIFEQAPQYKVSHLRLSVDDRKSAPESDWVLMLVKYWISSVWIKKLQRFPHPKLANIHISG